KREEGTVLINGSLSEAFVNFLNKALQQNPAKRYASGCKMLAALKQVYKKDKEYRKLCIGTAIARLILIAVLAAGIICIRQGKFRRAQELETEYNNTVSEMINAREQISSAGIPENLTVYVPGSDPAIDASVKDLDELYASATGLFENRPEAYYQKALSLYELHDYSKAVGFIDSSLQKGSIGFESSDREKLYYIQGNCLYQLGYLEEAAEAFENSIASGTSNPSVYSDYAIVLNALGRTSESEQMLKEAENNGIANDLLLLTEGEISLGRITENETRYVTAALNVVKTFQKCLDVSKDEYIRYRAYLGIVHAYDAIFAHMTAGDISAYSPGTKEEVLDKEITLLENAIGELPQKYRIQLYENLVQSCDRAYSVTGDPDYDTKAAGALEKIVESGYATIVTYENMCNIFRRQSRFDDAVRVLSKMASKYPDNYRVYMLFAFTYAQIEAQKDVDSRDYTKFFEYCDKAEQLYGRVSVPDIEMQSLHEIYSEIRDNGWQ
ncbi:MAG: hypothetical protein J5824_00810, partial [Lachnospiraceae bacterium]|nr:hypothetical protein [Lachnospiraceae bacterium]